MSDWTWQYVPDAANVVGGLTRAQIDEAESLMSRIADAVAVSRIGVPFDVRESVSNVPSGSVTAPAETSAGRSPKTSWPVSAAHVRHSDSKCGPATEAMGEWRRARTFGLNRKRRGGGGQVQLMNSAIPVYWHAAAAQT
jgi:hypothetical protein